LSSEEDSIPAYQLTRPLSLTVTEPGDKEIAEEDIVCAIAGRTAAKPPAAVTRATPPKSHFCIYRLLVVKPSRAPATS
jgi:hypothetical protein